MKDNRDAFNLTSGFDIFVRHSTVRRALIARRGDPDLAEIERNCSPLSRPDAVRLGRVDFGAMPRNPVVLARRFFSGHATNLPNGWRETPEVYAMHRALSGPVAKGKLHAGWRICGRVRVSTKSDQRYQFFYAFVRNGLVKDGKLERVLHSENVLAGSWVVKGWQRANLFRQPCMPNRRMGSGALAEHIVSGRPKELTVGAAPGEKAIGRTIITGPIHFQYHLNHIDKGVPNGLLRC